VRRSLRSLEAAPLLGKLPLRSLAGASGSVLEPATFTNGEGGVVVPRAWSKEPATQAACEWLPPADAGLLVRHASDYTLVLRALRWAGSRPTPAEAVPHCGGERGGTAYEFRFDHLGVPVAVRGVLVSRQNETLLLELEAPVAKLPIVEELYDGWVQQVAESH
jgi:hypothetical protein